MTALLTDWLRPLIAGAILIALLLTLAPEGRGKNVLKFASGALMTLLLLRPMTGKGLKDLYGSFESGMPDAAVIEEAAAKQAEAVYDSFICRETEEYIWNAARELGVETLGVRVVTDTEGAEPVTWEVYFRGCWSEAQRSTLSRLLETELGIGAERQYWSETDAD